MSDEATLDEFMDAERDESTESATDIDTLEQEQFGPFTLSTPGEWSAKRLGDVKKLITRGKQPIYDDGGIEVVNQECIYWDGWYFENLRYLDEDVGEDWKNKYFPQRGDVILNSTGQGTLGRAQVYPDNKRRAIDSHLTLLRTDDELNPYFHRYFLESHLGQALLYSMCVNGSTGQIELSKTRLDLQPIPLPPLPEQRKIATLLFTLDRAIEKTEVIIIKREEVKRGLMQDIFRYGIDSDGQLRPSEDQNPQDRKYGSAPQSWEILPLEDIVAEDASITYGIVKPGDHYPGGVPVIKVEDITNGEIQTGDLLHTDPEIHQKYDRAELNQRDLLFTIRGTVGRMAFVPKNLGGGNITQDTARIRVENANPEFVRYYLETTTPHNYFERHTKGQAVQGINLEDLQQVPVHLPPREEQKRIVEIIDSHTEQIQQEQKYHSRLKRLKRGLMQDLLSGTVRTTDATIEVPDEVAQHG